MGDYTGVPALFIENGDSLKGPLFEAGSLGVLASHALEGPVDGPRSAHGWACERLGSLVDGALGRGDILPANHRR